jgi:hypothetical protein
MNQTRSATSFPVCKFAENLWEGLEETKNAMSITLIAFEFIRYIRRMSACTSIKFSIKRCFCCRSKYGFKIEEASTRNDESGAGDRRQQQQRDSGRTLRAFGAQLEPAVDESGTAEPKHDAR